MFQVKTILNPRAFSEASTEAHKIACDLARKHEAKLVFLHVTEHPVVSYVERASELSSDELQRKLFEAMRLPTDAETGLIVEHRVVEGDPVAQILAIADETHCDLIVMGSNGPSGLTSWFTGNIAEEVIRKAECSVMVARTPREQSTNFAGLTVPA